MVTANAAIDQSRKPPLYGLIVMHVISLAHEFTKFKTYQKCFNCTKFLTLPISSVIQYGMCSIYCMHAFQVLYLLSCRYQGSLFLQPGPGGARYACRYRTDLQGLNNAKVVSRQLWLGRARTISTIHFLTFEEDRAPPVWATIKAPRRQIHKGKRNVFNTFFLPKVDLKQGEDVRLGPSRLGNVVKTFFFLPKMYSKQKEDILLEPSRWGNLIKTDDSSQWNNICREKEYRYRNGSDSSDKGIHTHNISLAPGGDWQANGANLTITKVEELAMNVIVWCRVSRLRLYMDSPSTLSNGNSSWSQPVIIDVAATTSLTGTPYPSCNASSPPPSHTPSPASSQSSVLGASIGSACVVIVALAALVVVVAIALIVRVSFVSRERTVQWQGTRIPGTSSSVTEPEQEYNSQDSLTQVYEHKDGSLYRKFQEHL